MTKVWEIGIDLSLHSVTCTTDYIDSQDYMYLLYNTMLSVWTLFFYNQSHNNAASSHPQNLTIDTCFLLFYWMPFMSFWYCNVMTWPHTRLYKIKYESDVGKWK